MDFKNKIIQLIKKEAGLEQIQLEVPPSPELGDYSFPCFPLASQLKKSPIQIAQELASKLKDNSLEKVEAKGPYLNFFINKKSFTESSLKEVLSKKKNYGKSAKKKDKLMVEFSGPNPFKGFHVGHLRNTVLGESLVRILKFNGYQVTPVNYLNDTGNHVAICLYGLTHTDKKPTGDKGEFLGQIYGEYAEREELKPDIEQIQRKIEAKDPKLVKLMQQGKQWSQAHFDSIYKDLDVHFDKYFYDSSYINSGKAIVQELLKKGVAEESEGAIIVNLEKYNLYKVPILRTNQTALYITKDLAMAKDRLEKHKLDRLIYVVGAEQDLHFKQIFKILELYGFKQASKCHHLSYNLVTLPEGKMSSRAGKVILYSFLKNELLEKLTNEVETRHKEWSAKKKKEAVKTIFSAAIKFDMLYQDPNKIIVFDIDRALNFEGETGPYVQYTHARICSILKKAKTLPKNLKLFNLSQLEFELIKKTAAFQDVVEKASQEYMPFLIARYALELSQLFNEFYHSHQILSESNDVKNQRLFIIQAVKQVLENALELLAIESPEEM
jgi:arginyl-tRNA synthetase